MPLVRIQHRNPFKLGLVSSGSGFLMSGLLQLALIGPLRWPVAATVLGAVMVLTGVLIPGRYTTKFQVER